MAVIFFSILGTVPVPVQLGKNSLISPSIKDRVSVPGGQNTGKLEMRVCKTLCPQLYACP